jgi:hypothetical protein
LSVHAYVYFIIRGLQRQSATACPEAFRFYRLFRPKDMTGRKQQARTNRQRQLIKMVQGLQVESALPKHNMEPNLIHTNHCTSSYKDVLVVYASIKST